MQTLYAASEDDYLKQLEMEADEGDNNSKSEKSEADYLKQLGVEADDEIADGPDVIQIEPIDNSPKLEAPSTEIELILDKKELIVDEASFVKALKATYPESFALYQELTDEQKKVVYKDFTKKKRLYNSSVKVISIYLSSH